MQNLELEPEVKKIHTLPMNLISYDVEQMIANNDDWKAMLWIFSPFFVLQFLHSFCSKAIVFDCNLKYANSFAFELSLN